MISISNNRNIGLDLARAVAILLVLIGHFELVSDTSLNYTFFNMGFFGVELFFVLSGFLIGQIIIKIFNSGLTFDKVKSFWYRRWLRTLPLYYLILILRELFFNQNGQFHYLHYLFLQTTVHSSGYGSMWFGESWSLVVEEWFYLLLPFLFLLIQKFKLSTLKTIFSFILLFVLFIALRYLYITRIIPSPDYNTELRIFAPLRLDSILFGVTLAIIKTHYSVLYQKLSKMPVFIIILISFIILNSIPNILVYNYEGIKTIPSSIGFSLVSLHFVLLIPFLENSVKLQSMLKRKVIYSIVTYTSLLSYCIYLIHEPLYDMIVTSKSYFSFIWWLQITLSLIVVYILGYISYRYFESPILRWRDKTKK